MKYLRMTALAAALMIVGNIAQAGCGFCKPSGCADVDAGCGSCKPTFLCCRKSCEMETVKKHCYEVECEDVCIPPVKLPTCSLFGSKCDGCDRRGCDCDPGPGGDSCGGCGMATCQECAACSTCRPQPRKGLFGRMCSKVTDCRIRRVHTMKKKDYEVEKCVCNWEAVRMQAPGCGTGCSKGCGDGCCAPNAYCAPCGE